MTLFARKPSTTRSERTGLEYSHKADVGCVVLLLLIATVVMLLRNSALPMQLWDESRNANNAFEMSRNGHALVTYFNGAPDHWNTKPPLLIWCMALLLHTGLSPLLAVRLPSILAATSTILLAWFFCRNYLHDRLAGLFAGLTLLSAPLFVGWHAGRTGDYDALVTFFTFLYALAFWNYLDSEGREQTNSIALATLAVALGILTKGAGAVLALPGLLLYAMARGQLVRVLRDGRLWLGVLAIALLSGSYFGLRGHLDPGYLHAVWINDVAGRYATVNPVDHGGPLFYVRVLATRFEPGFSLLPLALIPFFQNNGRRRSLVLICLITSAALFAVVTRSQTKFFWYIAPVTPLLALASGVGLSDGLRWLEKKRQTLPAIFHPRVAQAVLTAIFSVAVLGAAYYYQMGVERKLSASNMEGRYGPFLEQVRRSGLTKRLLVVDFGFTQPELLDFTGPNYSPEATFFAKVESARGMQVQIVVPGHDLPAGSWVATCDPRSSAWLKDRYNMTTVVLQDAWCQVARANGSETASLH